MVGAGLAVVMLGAIAALAFTWSRDAGPSTTVPERHPGAAELMARPRTPGVWPGPNGLSGVNGDPINDREHVERFCVERGSVCRVAHTYTDRTTYESMTRDTGWTFEEFDGFPGVLVVSQGLVPEGRPQDLAGCARGEFDQLWRDFGALMVRHDRADSVVRLGWEFNGTFMPWHGADTEVWIACYRRAADGIRATNPHVLLDWTINAHGTPDGVCGGVSTNCYPGDDYVDIVGIDNYDHWPAARTKADFDRIAAAPDGLDWLFAFARERGKPFSVGEWGVVPTGDAGRENPDFVRWMHAWFAAHAADLAYEAYFSNCDAGGVQSSLFRAGEPGCRANPGTADVYRELFGD
ncbi:glycoside hydrolase family 26 protein [Polymorphospora lycopeni]|uniref:Glycosyl hydrolase n=1 Tax=Polymorphospora lycopeni TaxID=3140240 RepID=A0ABV5CT54_9ACTN